MPPGSIDFQTVTSNHSATPPGPRCEGVAHTALTSFIREVVRRALLNLRHDPLGEWASFDKPGVLTPVQEASEVGQQMLDGLWGEALPLQPPSGKRLSG